MKNNPRHEPLAVLFGTGGHAGVLLEIVREVGGVCLAGDHPAARSPEGAGDLEPSGDPCLVLIGVSRMDEIAGIDEGRPE